MRRAVLALPAVADAVGECGLQLIEFRAWDIQVFVGHEPGKMLAHSLPHDSRFVVVDSEA